MVNQCNSKRTKGKKSVKNYTFWQALKDYDIIILSVAYFCWMMGYYGINMFLPTITNGLSAQTGLSTQALGWVIGLMYLFSMIVMYTVGLHSDKKNERRWHVASCLSVSAIAMVAAAYTIQTNVWLAFLLLTISLCGAFGAYSPFWAIPPSFLTGAAAGGGIAMINSIGNLGGFFGPYLVGWIRDLTGNFLVSMIFLGVSLILGGIIVSTLVKVSGKALVKGDDTANLKTAK